MKECSSNNCGYPGHNRHDTHCSRSDGYFSALHVVLAHSSGSQTSENGCISHHVDEEWSEESETLDHDVMDEGVSVNPGGHHTCLLLGFCHGDVTVYRLVVEEEDGEDWKEETY